MDTDSWGIGGDPVEIAREKKTPRGGNRKLKLSKDALVRELAKLKGIPLALAADEPPVFTLDNNALKLKKGKKLKGSTKNKTDCRCKHFFYGNNRSVFRFESTAYFVLLSMNQQR